jgi:hypothetical protein
MHFLSREDRQAISAINHLQRQWGLPTIKHSIWTGKLTLVPPPGAPPEMVAKCTMANAASSLDELDKLLEQLK